MITYTYIVKCPECEDEFFDFFEEAKEFALGCMSKKPIITQTEVNRNDFGECTDHCDLGTVWSWEDVMGKETDAEPTISVFTKDDLKRMADGKDPEFDNIDNSVDFEIEEDSFSTVADTINFLVKDEEEAIAGYEKVEDAIEAFDVENKKEILDTLDHIKAEEMEHIEELEALFNDRIEVTPERTPIPEGMTIEQLKEAMEENEDRVECAGCEELFPKEECFHKEGIGYLCGDCEDRIVRCTWCDELYDRGECRYEVDLGWLCDRCEAAIKSRGETLTFREGNYWDFLDEDFAEKRSLADLVKDSINHLVNDLGKDPWADDFADDVIKDIEDNYRVIPPRDMANYIDWTSSIASEVSRQVNRDYKLEEEISEVHDLGNEYDGGYPTEKPELPEIDETPEISDSHLTLCPECGKNAFDTETGICVDCGFN